MKNKDLKKNKVEAQTIIEPISFNPVKTKKRSFSPKFKKILISFGIILFILLIAYGYGVYYFTTHFLPNTFISGFDISYLNLADAADQLDSLTGEREIIIKGRDSFTSTLQASDIDFILSDSPYIENTLNNQDILSWPIYLMSSNNITVKDDVFNESSLKKAIANLSIVSGNQVIKTENARISYNGTKYVIIDEVFGTEVDQERLKEEISNALINGNEVILLEDSECYVKPTLTSKSRSLNLTMLDLNSILDTVITYDFKIAQEVLDKNIFATWMTNDDEGNPSFKRDLASNYVAELKSKYDTLGKAFQFNTSTGNTIEVTDWISGWSIDLEQEVSEIGKILLSGETITREPIYNSTGKDRTMGTDLGNTYLEISIPNQTMWFYKDGNLLISTPVVSGNANDHSTPTGLFHLQGKNTNVILKGSNGDGTNYASPVTYWLPFNGDIGVHDASWRSSFGESIYLGNGSHGCINTPFEAVKTIYDNITVGDPVLVY